MDGKKSENFSEPANENEHGRKQLNGKVGVDADASAAIRKSKAIFVEQVRIHVEQGQLSWEDVRAEANVIIAAVSTRSFRFRKYCY